MLSTAPHTDLATQMQGRLVTPADSDWDAVRQPFNVTADLRPEAIALPRDADDVIAAVAYAREQGLRVAAQATGHNAKPYGSLEGALLVDVRELQEVSVDPAAQRVRVGAGVKWERVAPLLAEHGLAALHGSSPDVGIAGYSLGGGMGWLARKYGLQANSVTAIELVTADGRLARVDADHEPELFWALRGGNGNFGVVTAIEFAVYPVAQLYAGTLFFGLEQAGAVLRAWTALLPDLPDEMMTWIKLMRFPDIPDVPAEVRGQAFTIVFGAFLGGEEHGRELLAPVRALGPAVDTFAMAPPEVLGDMAMDPPDPLPYLSATALLDDLPASGVDALVAVAGADSGSTLTMVEFRHLGGALARRAPGAGARASLPGEIVMFSLGVPQDEESARVVQAELDAVSRAVEPFKVGDYPNFVEAEGDARGFFDEDTWARLRLVKALYDPSEVFRGNHPIPPAHVHSIEVRA